MITRKTTGDDLAALVAKIEADDGIRIEGITISVPRPQARHSWEPRWICTIEPEPRSDEEAAT